MYLKCLFFLAHPVYIDLSKASDTLNYSILSSKLKYNGVQRCANNLLCSYLSERSHYVKYNGHKLNFLLILELHKDQS